MNQPEKKSAMFGATPPPLRNEKRRLIGMCVALGLVVFTFMFNEAGDPETQSGMAKLAPASASSAPIHRAKVKVPELRTAELEALLGTTGDSDLEAVDPAIIELGLEDANRLVAAHYDSMGVQEADLALVKALETDPAAARMNALRLRGFILAKRTVERENGQIYHAGTMGLDDGTPVHFAVSRLENEALNVGSSIRIDGLFVKMQREEVDGTWFDAPLVIGREMMRSFAPIFTGDLKLGTVNGPQGTFNDYDLSRVVNDDVESGIGSLPFEPKWKLMARAAKLQEGDIDWEQVPVLDGETLTDLLENGDAWSGMPIRLPLDGAALTTSTSRPAGENPARIERYTEGWLAEYSWFEKSGLVHFLAPFDVEKPKDKDPAFLGRGFFFKNLAYRSSQASVRVVPVLVLADFSRVPPADNSLMTYILVGVATITTILIGGIFLMLRRDRARSIAFQKQRSERRRQKRSAATSAG